MRYRVYTVLYDDNGNAVNRCPLCSTRTLELACSMARTNAGPMPTEIYEVQPDGRETRVR